MNAAKILVERLQCLTAYKLTLRVISIFLHFTKTIEFCILNIVTTSSKAIADNNCNNFFSVVTSNFQIERKFDILYKMINLRQYFLLSHFNTP